CRYGRPSASKLQMYFELTFVIHVLTSTVRNGNFQAACSRHFPMGGILDMKTRFAGMITAALMTAAAAVPANALDVAWVHSNAAAQSEQRVKAGFDAWLAETKKSDWKVNVLDSGGSGEQTATHIHDAARRRRGRVIIHNGGLR